MSKIMKYTIIVLSLFLCTILFFINQGVSGVVETFYPGTKVVCFTALLALEIIGLLWFWRGVFLRKPYLVFSLKQTKEEQERFAKEFSRRLRKNPLTKHLDPSAPDYLSTCLALLKENADKEIKRTAERVFVATALSQNGRIDALIVFVTLCRLVWRISAIYNQRPHPQEIASLYSSVISATFIALSFEELDIASEITVGFGEAFHSMAPAAMTGSMPFIGAALQKFTAATIDGAANSFLVLRTGIISRNAYAYAAKEEYVPKRTIIYKEAGSILLEMSGSLVDLCAKTLRNKVIGLGKNAQDKTLNAGKSISKGVAKVGGSIRSGVVGGVSSVGSNIAKGTSKASESLTNGATKASERIVSRVTKAGTSIVNGATKTSENFVYKVSSTSKYTVNNVTRQSKQLSKDIAKGTQSVGVAMKGRFTKIKHGIHNSAQKTLFGATQVLVTASNVVTIVNAKARQKVMNAVKLEKNTKYSFIKKRNTKPQGSHKNT